MPTFKVTLQIQDGLTLGHVLMTKGVELIHIVETDAPLLLTDGKSHHVIENSAFTQRAHFKHHSGKSIKEFIMEYMHKHSGEGRWTDLNEYIKSLGFGKSSLNSSLKVLVEGKIIKRENSGIYKMIEKK